MKLYNRIFRRLAEKGIVENKYEYYTDAEKEAYDYQQEQLGKLEAGEDIDPPWVKYSSTMSPWELRHKYWLVKVWLPFWRDMDEERRKAYKEKWNMPNEWHEVISKFWTDIGQDENRRRKIAN